MLFADNLAEMKRKFIWESPFTQIFCAALFASRGKSIDAGGIIRARKLLLQNSMYFASVRSTFAIAISAMIAAGSHEMQIKQIQQTYRVLKHSVPDSIYLPFAACVLAASADAFPVSAETEAYLIQLCNRTLFLYSRTSYTARDLITAAVNAVTAEQNGIPDGKVYSRYLTAKYLLTGIPESEAFLHYAAVSVCTGTDSITEKCRSIRTLCETYEGEAIPPCLFALASDKIQPAYQRLLQNISTAANFVSNAEDARACAVCMTLSEYGLTNPLFCLMEMMDSAAEACRAS